MTAIVWTPHGPADVYAVDQSFDGEYAVCVTGPAAYYSSDFGATWSDITPTFVGDETGTAEMYLCGISDDGTKVLVVVNDSINCWVYGSDDSGATFNRSSAMPFNNPTAFAVSGSGQYVAVGEGYESGDIYLSDDGAVTFAAGGAGAGTAFGNLAISQDGQKIAFLSGTPGTLHTTSDFGATWNTPSTPINLHSLALSALGNSLLIGRTNGAVYQSINFGTSFDLLGVSCIPPYLTTSGNGMEIMITDFDGLVLVSADGGSTFGTQTSLAAGAQLSEDGARLLATDGTTLYRAAFEASDDIIDPPIDGDPDGGSTSPLTPADGAVQSNPGKSATMATSTIVPPLVFNQYAVAWSEPLKMFVGSTGTKIYTSTNGKDWTLRYTVLSGEVGGPTAWGNEKFVVTGPEGSLYTSANGIAWTKQSRVHFGTDYPYLGESAEFLTLAYCNDKFVATFQLFGAIIIQSSMYSANGIAWTMSPTPNGMDARTPAIYSPLRELYIASYNDTIRFSGDGISWSTSTIASAVGLSNIVWTGDKFVMVDSAGFIYTSETAVEWKRAPSAMGITGQVSLVMVGSTIVGISEGRVFTSTDGQAWYKYNVAAVSGSAQLVTDNIRGYAYSASSLTIIYLTGTGGGSTVDGEEGSGDAGLALPMLELLATGYDDAEGPIGIARAKFDLPALTLEAHAYADSNARITLPSLKLIGYGKPLSGVARITLPMLQVVAEGSRTAGSTLKKKLPALTAIGYGGAQLAATLPMLQVQIEGDIAVMGRARIKLPRLSVLATGNGGSTGQARIEIGQSLSMVAYGGAQAHITLTQGLQLLATGGAGSIGRAQFKLPMLTLQAEGERAPTGGAEITLPMLRMVPSAIARLVLPGMKLYAVGHAEIDLEYEAYAVNLLNGLDSNPRNTFEASVNEVTHYTNYPFRQIVAFAGKYYGVAADGLHLLDGDTDAGEPIAWKFRTALSDMNSKKLKRIVSVYTGGRVIDGVEITLVVGEAQDLLYRYTTPRGPNAQNYRTMFGKGVRTRWVALEYSDPLGKAVTIDSIDIETEILERAI